jgi:hypothetical protein
MPQSEISRRQVPGGQAVSIHDYQPVMLPLPVDNGRDSSRRAFSSWPTSGPVLFWFPEAAWFHLYLNSRATSRPQFRRKKK